MYRDTVLSCPASVGLSFQSFIRADSSSQETLGVKTLRREKMRKKEKDGQRKRESLSCRKRQISVLIIRCADRATESVVHSALTVRPSSEIVKSSRLSLPMMISCQSPEKEEGNLSVHSPEDESKLLRFAHGQLPYS